jgi:Fe-S cluster assembly iron-binding protein IscA
MALDEPTEKDEKVEVQGISFIYQKSDEGYMKNSVIDFQDSFFGRGFVVRSATSGFC